MSVTLDELANKINRIERFLKTLVEVNLELIEEVEPESWEVEDVEERRRDEFLNWEQVEDEL